MKKRYTHTQVISTEAGLAVVQHDYEDSAPMGMADRIHNYQEQMRGGVFTPRQQRRLVKKIMKEEGQ